MAHSFMIPFGPSNLALKFGFHHFLHYMTQVGRWSYFEVFVYKILEAITIVGGYVGNNSWSFSN